MSKERIIYLNKLKKTKLIIFLSRIFITISFLFIWEYLSQKEIINSFIFSSPTKVLITIKDLYINNNLLTHMYITIKEVLISFILSTIISFIISIILYNNKLLKKILDPFITLFNSLPKVALGPLLIIWVGANQNSIILMSLLISITTTFITFLNGFTNTDKDKIKLFKIYNSSKLNILTKLIIPSSKKEIISGLKINLSLSLIGVISGEFLSCKKGIGYLILYGTQVFNLSLVITGIFILMLISFILYLIITIIENKTSYY